MTDVIEDVLAERYATPEMKYIWSPTRKVILGRELWINVLQAQHDLGMDVPKQAILRYFEVKNDVDLASIAERERVLKHDQLAEIEEFNALAGGLQLVHQAMTSRDKSDNTEQLQVQESAKLVLDRSVAVLARFKERAIEYRLLDMAGRSHLIQGQTITLGKRFATLAQEFMEAFALLEFLVKRYPLRGMKGAMGTQQDMIDRLGSEERALELEDRIKERLGFDRVLSSTGQVYPRLLDFQVVGALVGLASAAANFATMIRLMAGLELASEGTAKGQKGSSAMPHKTGKNSRTSERISGLLDVLNGYLDMISRLLGKQWFEGDVSCSVVRRVVLPSAFFAIDGLYESALHVLDEMKVYERAVERELQLNLPFLSTTALLMASVKKGAGREAAHTAISNHAVSAAISVQEGRPNNFVELLTNDQAIPLDRSEIEALIRPNHGRAPQQVDQVCREIDSIISSYPAGLAEYKPRSLR